MSIFFFFSSRRRHTRSGGDWSSDVCSSDLSHALWLMFLLFLPIAIFGLHSLYDWMQPDMFSGEERRLIDHKSPWLNQPGFIIRGVIYFAIWIGLAACLRRWSKQQDENR